MSSNKESDMALVKKWIESDPAFLKRWEEMRLYCEQHKRKVTWVNDYEYDIELTNVLYSPVRGFDIHDPRAPKK
jgi:hypothetical protein